MSTATAPASPSQLQSSTLDNYPFTAMNMLRCVEYINNNLIDFETYFRQQFKISHKLFRFFIKGGCAVNIQKYIFEKDELPNSSFPYYLKKFRDVDCSLVINPMLPREIQFELYRVLPAYILKYIFDFLQNMIPWDGTRREWVKKSIPHLAQDQTVLIHSTPYWEPYEEGEGISTIYNTTESFLANVPQFGFHEDDFILSGNCPFQVKYKTSLAFMANNFHSSLVSVIPRFEGAESFLDITILKKTNPMRYFEFTYSSPLLSTIILKKTDKLTKSDKIDVIQAPVVDILFLYMDQEYSSAHNDRENKKRYRKERADEIKGMIIKYYYKIFNKNINQLLEYINSIIAQIASSPRTLFSNKEEIVHYLQELVKYIRSFIPSAPKPALPPPKTATPSFSSFSRTATPTITLAPKTATPSLSLKGGRIRNRRSTVRRRQRQIRTRKH
jgi:hypothetical protein